MPPASKQVLIIENNVVVYLALQSYFQINDYSITAAKTGEKGIARASRTSPDLILLRGNLPDINGIEIIRRIHSSHGMWFVPIIFYTGSEWQKKLYRWNLPFNTHFLSSPFDFPRLDAIIEGIQSENGRMCPIGQIPERAIV